MYALVAVAMEETDQSENVDQVTVEGSQRGDLLASQCRQIGGRAKLQSCSLTIASSPRFVCCKERLFRGLTWSFNSIASGWDTNAAARAPFWVGLDQF